ncbi:MAG: hypothetical protein OEV40_24990 [Acidimicrobiia bacterium]|nr:hypothetical protein [Acidimicrobiia bacterium]
MADGRHWSPRTLAGDPSRADAGAMYLNFMGKGDHVLPAGWGNETVISVLGSARIDATAPSEPGAKLTVVTAMCGATVVVPPGARVELSGGDILGSHAVDIDPDVDGPAMRIEAIPVLGSIKIESA